MTALTLQARCALEVWRASGPRDKQRLLDLVVFFAETNGELANVKQHQDAALADVKEWEWTK